MPKKIKLILALIIMTLIVSTVVIVCSAGRSFDKNDPNTWYAAAKNGGIDDDLVSQIEVGMSLEEIVEIIGKPQRDIGSGVWQMEWEMKSGSTLVVSFNSVTSSKQGEKTRDLVSFHVEIKTD